MKVPSVAIARWTARCNAGGTDHLVNLCDQSGGIEQAVLQDGRHDFDDHASEVFGRAVGDTAAVAALLVTDLRGPPAIPDRRFRGT
jgi:hypothetical protein